MADDTPKPTIEELTARLEEVRAIKHQMCNELMGAIGHAQLLSQHPELSEKARQRIGRIREHCKNLTEQAEELSRLCRLEVPRDSS